MLVACPVVRIGEPFSGPVFTSLEELVQFLDEGASTSEQLNKTLGVVRDIESVMPGVSFDVILRKYVDSFEFR